MYFAELVFAFVSPQVIADTCDDPAFAVVRTGRLRCLTGRYEFSLSARPPRHETGTKMRRADQTI